MGGFSWQEHVGKIPGLRSVESFLSRFCIYATAVYHDVVEVLPATGRGGQVVAPMDFVIGDAVGEEIDDDGGKKVCILKGDQRN